MKRGWLWVLFGAGAASITLAMLRRGRSAMPNLKERVVIVTGASSGIGRATAQQFAKRGAHLVLVARREARLNELAEEIAPQAASVMVIVADVSRTEDLDRIVDDTMERHGRIDVLVNNAGVGQGGNLVNFDLDRVGRMIDINLYGPVYLARQVAPIMIEQGSGTVVNVASVAGEMRSPGMTVYSATKSGLIAFTDSFRREMMPHGVHSVAVLPGFTNTPMVGFANREEAQAAFKQAGFGYPGVRYDEPEDVAAALVEAVRKGYREVITGGPTLGIMVQISRRFPALMDLIYSRIDRSKAMSIMERQTGL